MTTEKLKTQIAELLKISDSEKNLAFSIFKNKIAEHLEVDEAIKISGIGVFQLKEQFTATKEKLASSKSKPTLIFSPIEKNDDESLFLTLELDDTNNDSMEFDEKVFNIGIDKPIIPIGDNKQKDSTKQLSIDKKISDIIAGAEKVENFDLWDDYLDKQAASILPDEAGEINDIDSYLQSDETGPSEDDFMELDEDEFLAEFENSELTVNEEISLTDEEPDILINSEDETIINLTEKPIEPANEILEDIPMDSDEIISSIDDVEEIDNLDEEEVVHKSDESIFYEAEDITEKESNDKEEIKQVVDEPSLEEVETEEPIKEESKAEETKDVLPIIKDETIENKTGKKMSLKKKSVVHNRRYSPTIYALIAAFFIVGGIGIYYLFFNNPTWLYDQNEIEVKLSEKHQREYEEAKKRARLLAQKEDSIRNANANLKNENIADNVADNNKEKKSENEGTKTVEKESNQKVTKETKSETKKAIVKPQEETKIVKNEVVNKKHLPQKKTLTKKKLEAPKNIYFDGTNYSLQISSWPNKNLAEKEVSRIKRKGYNAYIMKAYIPKFKKNWYRVRIGNLATIDEARRVQQEIK